MKKVVLGFLLVVISSFMAPVQAAEFDPCWSEGSLFWSIDSSYGNSVGYEDTGSILYLSDDMTELNILYFSNHGGYSMIDRDCSFVISGRTYDHYGCAQVSASDIVNGYLPVTVVYFGTNSFTYYISAVRE